MTNIIFSGIDKTFFNRLTFNNKVTASWLPIDELISTGPEVDSSNTKYVVFYNSPEDFLSKLGDKALSNLEQAEQQWLPQTELLVQFYLAHKDNAILVDSEQCEVSFDVFSLLVKAKLNIDCQSSNTGNNNTRKIDDGEKLLIQSLQLTLVTALSEHYDIQNTYENVRSAADLLVISDDYTPEDRACTLRDKCQKLVENIKLNYSKYTDLVKKSELSLSLAEGQVQQLQEELENTGNEHKKSAVKAADAMSTSQENNNQLTQDKAKLENAITELSAENELSLSIAEEQVQQLQEELETTHQQHKKSEEKLKHNLKLSKEAAAKAADEMSTSQESNNQLTQDKATLENDITELSAENELSLLQIQQLQEELEAIFSQHKSAEEQLKHNLKLSKEAADEMSTSQESNNQLTQDKVTLKNDITELSAENELSLLQIQQLQEELETTHHQHKKSEEKIKHNLKLSKEAAGKAADEMSASQENNNQLAQEKATLELDITELGAKNKLSLSIAEEQVQQLQEELEAMHLEKNQYKQKEKELAQQKNSNKESEQLLELKTENEIALLQIQQLQEELEFYFIKYQSLSSNSFISNITPINIADKRFEKSLGLARLLNA
ncbi:MULTISPECIES: hypothetical protein [Colwellia]|uniref:Chromosome partition protein Smc n=1 Tax=Colwellia marinimaniae TaxID=1513592 RepID=A0ABQ0MZL5_9GAMM|nr:MULTISPECIES: hypothetical protein [Colwellia]GAW97804.1 hypothetical protein MTCD1_03448 [Colwellia marinimaniae]